MFTFIDIFFIFVHTIYFFTVFHFILLFYYYYIFLSNELAEIFVSAFIYFSLIFDGILFSGCFCDENKQIWRKVFCQIYDSFLSLTINTTMMSSIANILKCYTTTLLFLLDFDIKTLNRNKKATFLGF